MDKKYKRLAKNSFWTLLGNTGSKVLGFLLLPLYTRWLGTSGFGESDLVTTYSSFLVCVMTMCVSDAIFVFTKNVDSEKRKIYFSTSLIFIILILLIWLLLWGVLHFGFAAYQIRNCFSDNLWLIYGIVVTTFLQQYSQQFILSLEKMKIYSLVGIIYTLLTFAFSYLLIPSMGVKGYILSIIYSNLITAAYSFLFSHSYSYLTFNMIESGRFLEVLKYSIPLIPNGIMWWLVSALNRPVMEYSLDYSSIGVFAVANRFPSVIMMIFSVFSVAWNISVFEEYGKDGYEDFYKKTFRMLFLVIVIAGSFVIVFSELVIRIFAAPDFIDAWKYMIILIIGAVFSCMSGFFGTTFGVVKKSKFFFYSSVWGAVTAIIFNFVLIPLFGLWGTSFSVLLSYSVMAGTRYLYSKKFVKVSVFHEMTIYVVALLLVATFTYLFSNLLFRVVTTVIILSTLLFMERDIMMTFWKKVKGGFTKAH